MTTLGSAAAMTEARRSEDGRLSAFTGGPSTVPVYAPTDPERPS